MIQFLLAPLLTNQKYLLERQHTNENREYTQNIDEYNDQKQNIDA